METIDYKIIQALWFAYWKGCEDADAENHGGSFIEAIRNWIDLQAEEEEENVEEET